MAAMLVLLVALVTTAVQVRNAYSLDLYSFDVDMNLGLIALTFSETVLINSLNNVRLQSSQTAGTILELTGSSALDTCGGNVIKIYLSSNDLNNLKKTPNLYTSAADTYLSFGAEAFQDTAGNPITQIDSDHAITVATFVGDTTSPEILSYALYDAYMLIEFSEAVSGSLNTAYLILETGTSCSFSSYGFVVDSYSTKVWFVIEACIQQAVSKYSTFLSVMSGFAMDTAGNSVREVAEMQASAIIGATTLNSFSINLDKGELTLSFSYQINPLATRNNDGFIVLQDSSGTDRIVLQTSSMYPFPLSSSNVITETISQEDLNQLKLNPALSFLLLSELAFEDASQYAVRPISSALPLQATEIIADTTAPKVVSFVLDINVPSLEISFSEPIDPASVTPSDLTLTDESEPPSFKISLPTDSLVSFEDSKTIMNVIIGAPASEELTQVYSDFLESTGKFDVYLSASSNLAQDVSGNEILPVEKLPAQLAVSMTGFDLDMDNGQLSFTFSKDTALLSSRSEEILLFNGLCYDPPASVSLQSSHIKSPLSIQLSSIDLSAMKANSIGTSPESVFLSFSRETFKTENNLAVTPVPIESVLPVSTYTPDVTGPQVIKGAFNNYENFILYITFDEPVNVNTVDATALTLLLFDIWSDNTDSYTLTGADAIFFNTDEQFSTGIELHLNEDDMNGIQSLSNVYYFFASTQFMFDSSFVSDIFGNPMSGSTFQDAKTINVNELFGFSVDMNTGRLLLSIQTWYGVDTSTSDTTAYTLSGDSDQKVDTDSLSLQDVPIAYSQDCVGYSFSCIAMNMQEEDITQIKANLNLLSDLSNSFISVVSGAFSDWYQSSNKVASGIQAGSFGPDTTPPELLSFIYDSVADCMLLEFSEPVYLYSVFDATVTISSGTLPSSTSKTLSGNSEKSTIEGTLNRQLKVDFSEDDKPGVNEVEASSSKKIYLSITSGFATDMAGNNVIPVNNLVSDAVIGETRLLSYAFDLNTGTLSLNFSDDISVAATNLAEVALQNLQTSSSVSVELGSSAIMSSDSDVVQVKLSRNEVNALKINSFFDINDYFISFTAHAFTDTDGYAVQPIRHFSALQVKTFTPDTTGLTLLEFEFDTNGGCLVLTFEEPTAASSVDPTRLTLLNPGSSSYTLTGSKSVEFLDDLNTELKIVLLDDDFNAINDDPNVGTTADNTYVSFESDFATDVSGNPIITVEDIMAALLIKDTLLYAFEVDMNAGVLRLSFAGCVAGVNLALVTLQDAAKGTVFRTIEESNGLASDGVVTIEISTNELNKLKHTKNMFNNEYNSYITITSRAFLDCDGFGVPPIKDGTALRAYYFESDYTSPELIQFCLDLRQGTLQLTFTEPIDGSYFVVQDLELRNDDSGSCGGVSVCYPLTGSSGLTFDECDTIVTLTLNSDDLNNIISNPNLAANITNTYLYVYSWSVRDVNYNYNQPVGPIQASKVIPPLPPPPQLIIFSVDMNTGTLQLIFTDEIVPTASRFNEVTLQNAPMAMLSLTLSSETTFSPSQPTDTLNVHLTGEDLNSLKQINDLYTSETDSFLTFGDNTFQASETDSDGTLIYVVPIVDGRLVDSFSPDVTPPIFESFSVDMDSEIVLLTFNEPIIHSSFLITALTLQDSLVPPTTMYVLSESTVTSDVGLIIKVLLFSNDLDKLKIKGIFKSINTSFAVLSEGAVQDTSGNIIEESSAIQASSLVPDTTRPSLTHFDTLDLDDGFLVIVFDEAMDLSSISFTYLTLTTQSGSPLYTLTGGLGSFLDSYNREIKVELTESDLLSLQEVSDLATSVDNTYLALTSMFATDVCGNSVLDLELSDPLPANDFVPDTISLVAFSIDMNSGDLVLTFSDEISDPVSMLDLSEVVLQNAALSPTKMIDIGSAITLTTGASQVIDVKLSKNELWFLKYSNMYSSRSDSYLSIAEEALQSTKPFIPIGQDAALMAQEYIVDETSPSLVSFRALVTVLNKMELVFSEPLSSASIMLSELTIQSDQAIDAATVSYTLTGGDPHFTEYNTVLEITLTNEDLSALAFATVRDSTYLSFTSSFVTDTALNPITPIPSSNAVQIATVLTGFSLDMNSGFLTLSFNGPVPTSCIDPTDIELTTENNQIYSLVSADTVVSPPMSNSIDFQLSKTSLDSLKLLRSCVSNLSLPLGLTCLDPEGQNVTICPSLPISDFVKDVTPPSVVYFEVDMDSGTLVLFFDEPIDVISNEMVILQNSASNPEPTTFTLPGSSSVKTVDDEILVTIQEDDLNAIKTINDLYSGKETSFVIPNVADLAGNFDQNAWQADSYIPDTTSPCLIEAQVGLVSNVLILSFNEPVLYTSLEGVASSFELQNRMNNPTKKLTISDSVNVMIATFIIEISLSNETVSNLQSGYLTECTNQPFVAAKEPFSVKDTSGNSMAMKTVQSSGSCIQEPKTNSDVTISWEPGENLAWNCRLVGPGNQVMDVDCSPATWSAQLSVEGKYQLLTEGSNVNTGKVLVFTNYIFEVDLTPPVASFATAPNSITNQADFYFTFGCNEGQCSFECQYWESGAISQEFAPCAQQFSIIGVSTETSFSLFVRATDQVGNEGEAVGYSWITDFTAPTIFVDDKSANCNDDLTPASVGGAQATDNRPETVTLTYIDDTSLCSIERIWSATDFAGNTATQTQTISLDFYPEITLVPTVTLFCDGSDITVPANTASAPNACKHELTLSSEDSTAMYTCPGSFTRTWTVTDGSCNQRSSNASQVVTIINLCPPEACGRSETPPHGICVYGECICYKPWYGESCDQEIYEPMIVPVNNVLLQESENYVQTMTLDQGTPPLSWSLFSNSENYVSFNMTTGQVSWTSLAPGNYTFTVVVQNTVGMNETTWLVYVQAGYDVILNPVNPDTYSQAQAIELTGRVEYFEGSIVSGSVPVMIDVYSSNGAAPRQVTASTETDGTFSANFYPAPSEYGSYTAGGRHPSEQASATNVQAEWIILGMRATVSSVYLYGEIELDTFNKRFVMVTAVLNSGPGALSGLQAETAYLPDSLPVSVYLSSADTLSPGSEAQIDIEVTSSQALQAVFPIYVTTAEGVSLTIPVYLTIKQLRPNLVSDPPALTAQIIRGNSTLFNFEITNVGEATAHSVRANGITYENVDISVVSFGTGEENFNLSEESAVVSILVNVAEEHALGVVGLSFLIESDETQLYIDLKIIVSSDLRANYTVTVEDEYTYFADGEPLVNNANIRLINFNEGVDISRSSVEDNGRATFINIREGYYNLYVEAPQHLTIHYTVFVSFDTSSVTVFLERQAVSYSFSVTPTTIQETYEIHIEADFETDVPIPVITMTPTEINLEPLESGEMDSFQLTVENHGLIRGENGNFELPEHDFLEFDLGELNSIGDIEPKSSVTVTVRVNMKKKKRAVATTIITSIYVINLAYSYVCGDLQTRLVKVFLKKETYTETEIPEIIIVDPPPPPMPPPCYTCVEQDEPSIITIPVPGIFGPPSTYTIGYEASTPSFCNQCLQSIFDCVPAPKFPGSDRIPLLLRGEIAINDLQSPLDWLEFRLSLPWPSAAPNVQDSSQSSVSGGSKALKQLRRIKKFLPFAQCGYELYLNCFSSESDVSDDIEALIESMYPIHLSIATAVEVFGDSDWMSVEDSAWLSDVLRPTMSDYSNLGAMISEEEYELIVNNPAPMRVTEDGEMVEMSMEKVITFIQRLNNTISGWNEGFLEPSDGHTNLASYSAVTDMFDEIENYNEMAKARGFSSYIDAYNHAANEINQFDNWEDEAGVCAVVKISIGQQLSLTREAFNAKLEIENMESSELTNIHVDITIHRSPTGEESSHLFSIGEASLSGAVTDSGDYWSLPSNGAGAIEWLLVAYDEAAPTNENEAYYVGGRLQYILAGNNISVPLLPTRITITPNPSLVIHYFLEKEVISDDPFTEPVEPAVPFVLAVAVTNNGSGVAMNVQIASAQPSIVNNEKGLLAEFRIIGSRMACDEINPSLTVNFGDIAANEMKVALWEIESSIKGEFIDYSASFDVINPLGDPDLSIVKEVRIHEIVRVVEVEGMDDNCTVLFLVDDEVDDEVQYPETLISSTDLQQFAVELGQVQDVVTIPTNNGSDEGATSFVMHVSRHTFDISDANSSWLYFRYVDTAGLLNADLTVFNVTKHESDSNTDINPYLDPRHVWITTDEDDNIVVNVIDPQGISGEALYFVNPIVVPTSTSIFTTPTSTSSQSPTPPTTPTPSPTPTSSSRSPTPLTTLTPIPSSTPDCFDPLADYACIE